MQNTTFVLFKELSIFTFTHLSIFNQKKGENSMNPPLFR